MLNISCLDDSFWNLVMIVKGKKVQLVYTVNVVIDKLHMFMKVVHECKKKDPFIIALFTDMYFYDILDTMNELKMSNWMDNSAHGKTVANLYKYIFSDTFNMEFHPNMNIVGVCHQFMKGITLFSNSIMGQNFNLRLTAPLVPLCTNERKFKYKVRRGRTRKTIEHMYIERLVYASVYKDIKGISKDSPYITKWIESSTEDYKRCFPNTTIEVFIDEYSGSFPTNVTLVKSKNGQQISTRIYRKSLVIMDGNTYGTIVECHLVTNSCTKAKIQRYEKESHWISVNNLT